MTNRQHPEIHAIFLSEFHPIHGPRIALAAQCGTPLSVRPSLLALFDTVSEFLIPKPSLCDTFVAIGIEQYRMLGHPVLIQDPKYPRNVALWNLVLVVDRGADARGLRAPARKLAAALRSLELELEYVTAAVHRPALQSVLQQLVTDLNSMREARIPVPGSPAVLDVRLAPVRSIMPPEVQLWDVPVSRLDLARLQTPSFMGGCDLVLRRLVPLIDGVRPVAQLAAVGDMDPALARVAVQHLVYVGAVALVDLFQTSNMYIPTPKLRRLAADVFAQEEAVRYISIPQPPLYAALKPGVTIADLVTQGQFPTAIADARRFAVLGVLKGWLRRVHRYPIL
ncbi:nitrogen permease regulator 2, partial [Blastocladiella britannica]